MVCDNSSPMFELVADRPALIELTHRLSTADWIGLDTEFVRETTYWPKLCLVQVSTREGVVALVDPIALGDITPLLDILWKPDVLKVYHAGSQDLELFYRLRGALPGPVFDTQVAAALTGDDDQIGYAAAVEAHLAVKLAKAHTRTDWSRRPLKAGELEYAAEDVLHLPALYAALSVELESRGRMDWALSESLVATDPVRYAANPDAAWKRVKGMRDMDGTSMAILRALAAWRERTAESNDRPRRWILGDEPLVRIARDQPADVTALAAIEGMPAAVARKHAAALLAVVEAGRANPLEDYAAIDGLDRKERDRVDALMKHVRARSQELRIAPAMLATRKDCEAIVRGTPPAGLLTGWRAGLIGEELLVMATP